MSNSRGFQSIQPMRVIAAFALGIAVTVVVTWTFSANAIYQRTQSPAVIWNAVQSGSSDWVYSVRRGTGWLQIHSNTTLLKPLESGLFTVDPHLQAPAWSKVATASSDDPDSYVDGKATLSWREVASGWPMFAMRSRERLASTVTPVGGQNQVSTKVTIQYGHAIRDQFGLHNILPLRPMWPGFVINTIVFAIPSYLMLALVGGGIAMLRVFLRRRKGLCATCGYDLSGLTSEVCPECGQAHLSATIAAATGKPEP